MNYTKPQKLSCTEIELKKFFYEIVCITLTNGSVVRSNNFGPSIAGAKNRRNINPDTTEYRTSLLCGKYLAAHSLRS